MDVAEYHALREHGILDKIELIRGQVVMGDYPVFLAPTQMRAARALGIEAPSCVDAVLADELALAELISRLNAS